MATRCSRSAIRHSTPLEPPMVVLDARFYILVALGPIALALTVVFMLFMLANVDSAPSGPRVTPTTYGPPPAGTGPR